MKNLLNRCFIYIQHLHFNSRRNAYRVCPCIIFGHLKLHKGFLSCLCYILFSFLLYSKEDSEKPWYRKHDTDERNQKAKKAYEALMTVTLRKPTSPAYRNFSEEVKRRAGNDSFTYGEDEVNYVFQSTLIAV